MFFNSFYSFNDFIVLNSLFFKLFCSFSYLYSRVRLYESTVTIMQTTIIFLYTETSKCTVAPSHALAGNKSLRFEDLNGNTMLLRGRLGFWKHITDEKLAL